MLGFIGKLFKGKTHPKDVFCIMPWVHFHVTQNGTVTPCCQAPWQEEFAFGNINQDSIHQIWHNEKFNSFRKNMQKNQPSLLCSQCYKKEEKGAVSMRQITNKKYAHYFESVKTVPNQSVYFDLRFSNICNLKCRTCGPWSSSSWFNDAVELGLISKTKEPLTYAIKNTDIFFNELNSLLVNAEDFYFAGGEPLMMTEHYKILEELIHQKRTDILLTYNTNFSILRFKQYDILALWKNFKKLSLSVSLDASGKRGELLRKNLKWEDVIANRKALLNELPNIEFTVTPKVCVYNLIHLPDFHKEWVNDGLISAEDFIPSLLINPQELNISNLPFFYKKMAFEKYEEHLIWIEQQPFKNHEKSNFIIGQYKTILSLLEQKNQVEASTQEIIKHIDKLDALRVENTLEVFPELRLLFA
jgi:radical SAM protein with 4Fe4S-binding SPASM domain